MNEQELERLAARLVSGPREPGLYGRTLEAAAATRRGLERLQELAETIEGTPGPPRPLTDPGQVDRLRPGDRLARHPDPDSAEAATDLLDEAAGQLGFVLASGSIRDLTRNLDRLTDEGLREQMTAALTALLKTLPPGDLEHLRQVVDRWPGEPRPPWPRRPTSLVQLARALSRVPEKRPTIEAAWDVLTSETASFARRWAAGVHLCRLTRERVRTDPAQAATWAARVVQTAPKLAAPSGPAGEFESRMADILATFASAHVGNALRVQGHLLVAERFFLPWDEDDQLGLRAEYLALKATLRRVQRRPAEAIALFEEADRIASRGDFPGALELTARIRIAHARTLETLSEVEAAATLLQITLGREAQASAIKAMPPGDLSPRLRYMALENLADCLSKAGHFEEAARAIAEADEVGKTLEHPEVDLLRTRWIRSRLEVREAWHAGVDALRAVQKRFVDFGLIYDAALASLELAQWHAQEIRGAESDAQHVKAIRELASESAAFFAGQDVGPEALAALALFQHVSAVAVPTPEVLRKIERLLRQAAV